MSKAVFSDFRRDSNGEPIELLKYAPSKEKLCTNGGDDRGLENTKPECKPQLTDHPKNGGVRSHQDGGSDEDKGPTFAKRLSSDPRRTSFEQRRLQNYFYKFLEQPRGWHNVYHVILVVLVLGSLVMTVLSTVAKEDLPDDKDMLKKFIFSVELILVLVFVVEYIVRLWSAGCCSCYVGLQGRIRFALKPYAILDIIVIISSILALSLASMGNESAVEVIRFLPLLRVLRFDRQGGTWKLLGSVIYVHRKEMLTTIYLGFISLILASFVMYLSEKRYSGEIQDWPDSFWWGIVTLTTVGYGDKVPQTWHGKLLAAVFAVCGISFFALPAGILGSGFALKVTQEQRQKHFHRRRRPAAVLLQSYWRLYCADINSKSVATWLPHIYYNRQQETLQRYLERGSRNSQGGPQVGLTVESASLSDSMSPLHKRKRSARNNKLKNDVKSGRSDSVVVAPLMAMRKVSTTTIENEFLDVYKTSLSGSTEAIISLAVPGPASTECSVIYTKKDMRQNSVPNEDEVVITAPADGEVPIITLTNAQKHAICLIRLLKLLVAVRKFKEARRPYDVKDVMEQYSAGHVEMLSRIKTLQTKLDKTLGIKAESGDGFRLSRTSVMGRLARVENQVQTLDQKLDMILQILQTRSKLGGSSDFRGSNDGRNGSRVSVHRTYSDPSEAGTRTSVTSDGDTACVTPRTNELTPPPTREGSCSGESLVSPRRMSEEDGAETADVSASSDDKHLSALGKAHRQGLADKRQLSDVTEEGNLEGVGEAPEDVRENSDRRRKEGLDERVPEDVRADSDCNREENADDDNPVWLKREPVRV